ncbi:MAG TPA: 4Fe-4S binding protein, partial [Pararhodobacter sp.]|uniref:4Fe-4S binding protein n=1 Tax=Pararhodobacter sp. TaxID=2127056 RepID=UPI002BE3B684
MLLRCLALVLTVVLFPVLANAQTPHLQRFLVETDPSALVEGADGFGAIRSDAPVAPLLRGTERIGWAYITSDFVGTTGYSGKPIHIMVAVDDDARILGINLVHHAEPIVLIGIPESRIRESISAQIGLDLAALANGGEGPALNIVSGATVTIMVIDDSIQRSGIRVARLLGLGGLTPQAAQTGPRFEVNPEAVAGDDWFALVGDGSVRRMTLDVGQVNAAFEALDDPRAARRALTDPPETTYIDLYAAMVSVPGIGRELMGEAEYANLTDWLEDGEHAIFVGGLGQYSFKGSGYVRGGIFDRIVLIQGDVSIRFRDRDHRRLGSIATSGAPQLSETDIFRIHADSGFDPAEPWRLQLLVQRDVAALERAFTTFDLGYQLPRNFVIERAVPVAASTEDVHDVQAERDAQMALIERIWTDQRFEIIAVLGMLFVLTAAFFFQGWLTRSERVTYWFRMSFLTVTLFFLGWYANAQLSVVNVLALFQSMMTGFSWQAFLLDPLTFILWFSVAAAMIFWGRGAYCGWLCPFGALQELTNQIGRKLRIPQFTLPWGLHERLWPIKYMIFLALFGASLASLEWGERMSEIEPFKTAIVLRFDRAWPFVLFA